MRDKDLYTQILGLQSPWQVSDVELNTAEGEVKVHVELEPSATLSCPKCGSSCTGYDKRLKQWRHLDTCQFKTILEAQVPRIQCPEHGVLMIKVPWAEPGSGFTALFEALVIDWLKEASIQAIARQMNLSWNVVDGIMQRAVKRGMARRKAHKPKHLGIDETSFRKGHDYVSVITDTEEGIVLHVAQDRTKASLDEYYDTLKPKQKAAIQSISMDMWQAYISSTLEHIPEAKDKIAFDKFHVAKYLGEAVDKVRKAEHKTLQEQGRDDLTGSKYTWLRNPQNMSSQHWREFKALRESVLKTARAWAIKEFGMSLWHYVNRTWAEKGWKRWLSWAVRSRLEPIKKVANTIKEHLWGILNAVVLKADNALAESINSRIKMVKVRARGFRNKQRFCNAIYFYLGGLNLYPETAK